MMGLIFSLIAVSTLKNGYHFYKLKKSKNWWTAFIISLVMSETMWFTMPLGVILHIIMKNTGAYDQIRTDNIKKDQEETFRTQMAMRNRGMNPAAASPNAANPNAYANNVTYRGEYHEPFAAYPQQPVQQPFYGQQRFDSSLSYNLPKNQRGREKILKKFSNNYNLNLDSNDIKTIASASYFSIEWASEISAMNHKYNSVYEWMGSGRSWLRIYISVFNLVDIFSVFSKQEEYVFETFDRIFSDICVDENLPVEVVVENINRKDLTNFDEISFMQAIAYMEANGRSYRFGAPLLNNVDQEVENLQKKYDGTPMA